MNKIISMSVWGNNPRYILGAKRQIDLAKKYYPDWKIRIYTDNPLNFLGEEIETVKISDGSYGMFWRFLALFDSEENIVMVRDSDSRTTIREQRCIQEWLSSDKTFHTFKDHEAHYEFPIIGCSFALKGKLDDTTRQIMLSYMNREKYYCSDQNFLRDYVWGQVQQNAMVHSMQHPGWFSESRKKLKNPFSFCGNGYDERDMPLYPNSLDNMANWNPQLCPIEFKFDEGVMYE